MFNKLASISILKILTIVINLSLIKIILHVYSDLKSNEILEGLFLLPFIAILLNFGCVNRLISEININKNKNNFFDLYNNFLTFIILNLFIVLLVNNLIFEKFIIKNVYIFCSFFFIIIHSLNELLIIKGRQNISYTITFIIPTNLFFLIFLFKNIISFEFLLFINYFLVFIIIIFIYFKNFKNFIKFINLKITYVNLIINIKYFINFTISQSIFYVPIIYFSLLRSENNYTLSLLLMYRIFFTLENSSIIVSTLFNSKFYLKKYFLNSFYYLLKLISLNFIFLISSLTILFLNKDLFFSFFEIKINDQILKDFYVILITYILSSLFGSFIKNNVKLYGLKILFVSNAIFFGMFILLIQHYNFPITFAISLTIYKLFHFILMLNNFDYTKQKFQ